MLEFLCFFAFVGAIAWMTSLERNNDYPQNSDDTWSRDRGGVAPRDKGEK